MKAKSLLRLTPLLLVLASCASSGVETQDHWHLRGVGPRIERQFIGSNQYTGERPWEYLKGEYRDLALTSKRHFLNLDPSNPLQRGFFGGGLRLDSSPLRVGTPPSPDEFEVRNK